MLPRNFCHPGCIYGQLSPEWIVISIADVSVCVKVVSRCEFNLESECVIPDFQLVGALLIPGEF